MSKPLQARAIATRHRLMQATVSALVEHGYAGTTTQAVCREAGVSRGTLLYHFPTRETLLVAALDHVLSERVSEFVAQHQGEGTTDVHLFVESMWVHWQGPALIAWLELAVAARTQPGLREPMRRTMAEFDQQIQQAFRVLQPVGALPEPLESAAPFFVFAVLNGLAVGRSYEDEGHARPVLDLLIMLAQGLGPTLGGSSD